MRLWAIVPAKPFAAAKTRLNAVLGNDEREALAREMLERTLATVVGAGGIARVIVVSRDPEAQAIARARGADVVEEGEGAGLNEALRLATAAALRGGAEAVLVLPTDLPLLLPDDLDALRDRCSPPPAVVVAPDRVRRGTNALVVAPPALIEYAFGEDSFSVHIARANAVGARLEICVRPGLRLDIDGPDDLRLARRAEHDAAILPGD
jgi:2-phospho-L-lactate guanylyltransferase